MKKLKTIQHSLLVCIFLLYFGGSTNNVFAQHDPIPVASIPCTPSDVFVSSNFAYVVGSGLLTIYDITDPSSPALLGSTPSPQAKYVSVTNSMAYVSGQRLEIFDVSDPANPTLIGNMAAAKDGLSFAPGLVVSSGDYVYVVNTNFSMFDPILGPSFEKNPTLQIVDVTNPTLPVPVASVPSGGGVVSINALRFSNNTIFLGIQGSVRTVDVSDPTAPKYVGYISSNLSDIQVRDGYVYIAANQGDGTLDIYDLKTPEIRQGRFTHPAGTKWTRGVDVAGDFAFVTAGNTLEVVDVYDQGNPVHAGSVTASKNLGRIFILGDFAYITTENSLEIFSLPAPIERALQFDPIPVKRYLDNPFELVASSEPIGPISFSSSDPTVATVLGNIVTVVGLGTCTIKAWKGADQNDPASFVTRTLQVIKARQKIAFDPAIIPAKTIGDPPFQIKITVDSGLPLVVQAFPETISLTGSENRMVEMNRPGPGYIRVHQDGNEYYETAFVEKNFCVNPAKPAITYDASRQTLYSTAEIGNQWFLNGVAIKPGNTQSLIVSEAGNYTVQVSLYGCKSETSDEQQILMITGVEPEHESIVVRLAPNPSTDIVNLTIEDLNLQEPVKLEVLDLAGREIYDESYPVHANAITINVSGYRPGIYIVVVRQANKVYRTRFIKT